MKKILKVTGIILAIVVIAIAIFYYRNNEGLPVGKQGIEADALATKMLTTLNYNNYKNTEVLEWSFRKKHFYKWNKKENIVRVEWDQNVVELHTKLPNKSKYLSGANQANEKEYIQLATDYFNNDSFWLIAPYKVFDIGVERRLVNYKGKDALLITYTSGGSTPGDSYLWILDKNGMPTSYKMWVSIIPIGGIEATWSNWNITKTGISLPTKHNIDLFGLELDMGTVRAYNPKANELAQKILTRINHKAYKNTRFLEWSFRGKRFFKWDKERHIVNVNWGNTKVILHPNKIKKSKLFINNIETNVHKDSIVKRAEAIFNNDSFWLIAPHKLFEPGIIRSIKKYKGKDVLKVLYTTGGTTPGDSYIWILDDTFLPIKYLMNVPSMKMNKVPATWEDWITTESGALLPKNHSFSNGGKLSMGDVKGTN